MAALLIVVPSVLLFPGRPEAHTDPTYQMAEFDTLLGGNHTARSNVGALQKNGDIGLGTFTGLDGEMIVQDGK